MSSKIKINAYLTDSASSVELNRILQEIEQKYGDKVDVEIKEGGQELAKEYKLPAVPAIVVDGIIRIIGFCPSQKTLVDALWCVGME